MGETAEKDESLFAEDDGATTRKKGDDDRETVSSSTSDSASSFTFSLQQQSAQEQSQQQQQNAQEQSQQHSANEAALNSHGVILLGTGSSEPSPFRGPSAILLRTGGTGGMMLDCGEGTFGAMIRLMGDEVARAHVAALQAIWISHKHADHVL
eukprot:CAMPEP_0175077016 /NCGR_PEP_ID=MMETSP0052_2-20121109/23112_1 /TAXON_ID=51329 ORGANISM="Polytomella parva, Strain SAG 63-3" /NCGR_SAMPLE_ID=MMETSP0052_2 /ASSEMBLY_ACC=CAM_ASM_000194 /LENGTH=152 /DNA_ID=CAMNT_0016346347 /DNA_START=24 /DNA_END=478 /DNA_ORIENTATION=+